MYLHGWRNSSKKFENILNASIGRGIYSREWDIRDRVQPLSRWEAAEQKCAFSRNGKSSLTIGRNCKLQFHSRDELVLKPTLTFTAGESSSWAVDVGATNDFGDNSRVVFGRNQRIPYHSGKGLRVVEDAREITMPTTILV